DAEAGKAAPSASKAEPFKVFSGEGHTLRGRSEEAAAGASEVERSGADTAPPEPSRSSSDADGQSPPNREQEATQSGDTTGGDTTGGDAAGGGRPADAAEAEQAAASASREAFLARQRQL